MDIKKVNKSVLSAFVILQLVMLTICSNASAQMITTMPNVSTEMLNSQYWIDKIDDAGEVIMTAEEIQSFNEESRRELSDYVVDLKNALKKPIENNLGTIH